MKKKHPVSNMCWGVFHNTKGKEVVFVKLWETLIQLKKMTCRQHFKILQTLPERLSRKRRVLSVHTSYFLSSIRLNLPTTSTKFHNFDQIPQFPIREGVKKNWEKAVRLTAVRLICGSFAVLYRTIMGQNFQK